MKHKAFKASASDRADLERVAGELEKKLGRTAHPPPPELIGDILIALTSRHPSYAEEQETDFAGDTMSYSGMWRHILRGRKWKFLSQRIGLRRRQKIGNVQKAGEMREHTLKLIAGLLAFRFMHVVFEKHERDDVATQDVEMTASEGSMGHSEEILETREQTPDKGDDFADMFAHIAAKYDELALEEKDYSTVVADPYVFVMLELARRAINVDTLDAVVDRELTLECLKRVWDQRTYKPRQLRVVTRLGDENQMLPGNYLGIRGVTKKIREDQIPKILPSEFSMWNLEPNGKLATLDNIINRSPPCYEHYDTRRPEIKHRTLLLFVTGFDRNNGPDSASVEDEQEERRKLPASVIGKTFAFELLVAAALKTPHQMIQTDVAWFECRDQKWHGWEFPLLALDASRLESDNWRNVIAVDRVLSHFFVLFVEALKPHARSEVNVLAGTPSEFCARVLRDQNYQAVFVAGVMRDDERKKCLPSASIRLPRFDSQTPTILFATAQDGEDSLRGDTFGDLMGAHIGLLPAAAPAELVQQFMTMILGPQEQRQVLPTI